MATLSLCRVALYICVCVCVCVWANLSIFVSLAPQELALPPPGSDAGGTAHHPSCIVSRISYST